MFTSSTTNTLRPLLSIIDNIQPPTTIENYVYHRLWKLILEDEEIRGVSQIQTTTQQKNDTDTQTQIESLPSCSNIRELLKNYKYGNNPNKVQIYSIVDRLISKTITNNAVFNKPTDNVLIYTSKKQFYSNYKSIIQQLKGQKNSIPHVISVYSIIPIVCINDDKNTKINVVVIISIP